MRMEDFSLSCSHSQYQRRVNPFSWTDFLNQEIRFLVCSLEILANDKQPSHKEGWFFPFLMSNAHVINSNSLFCLALVCRHICLIFWLGFFSLKVLIDCTWIFSTNLTTDKTWIVCINLSLLAFLKFGVQNFTW